MVLGLGIAEGWLGTWVAPELPDSGSQTPEFEPIIDSQSWDSSLDAKTIHQLLLVLLGLFLRNKLLFIVQFLGNLLLDFLGRVYSSFPTRHTSLFYEPGQPIDSPVVAVIVGIQTPD